MLTTRSAVDNTTLSQDVRMRKTSIAQFNKKMKRSETNSIEKINYKTFSRIFSSLSTITRAPTRFCRFSFQPFNNKRFVFLAFHSILFYYLFVVSKGLFILQKKLLLSQKCLQWTTSLPSSIVIDFSFASMASSRVLELDGKLRSTNSQK